MRTRQQFTKKARFSLIEILVVVAIIGILASLLMPSLSKAKKKAVLMSCINNQKQLGFGVFLYLTDSDDYYPMLQEKTNGEYPWERTIFDYVSRSTDVFVCPGQIFNPVSVPNTMTLDDGTKHTSFLSYQASGANNAYWDESMRGNSRASSPMQTGWSNRVTDMESDTLLLMDFQRSASSTSFGKGNYSGINQIVFSNHDMKSINMTSVDGSVNNYKVSSVYGNSEFGDQYTLSGNKYEYAVGFNTNYISGRFKGFGR